MATTRPYNRLALRIAMIAAAAVLLTSLSLLALVAVPGIAVAVLLAFLIALITGVTVYATSYSLVARRIELARETLRQSRKHRFEALAAIPQRSARDELDALVHQTYRTGRTLQQEIERLERLENYRREYLGDVSHELRTPIFAISGFAETLLDGALEDDNVSRRFVEKIEANASRLEALTRDLAEISSIETGELKMTMEPFELAPIVQETVDSLELLATDRQIELTAQIPTTLPHVLGDRMRIRQVISNLVENAIKYNQPGGRVEVMARSQPVGEVRVVVVDDGIGIPIHLIGRLTERFFRADKSRSREQGGTGLGLAIVKHILEAHGQRLRTESQVDYGSKFFFNLPAA